MKNTNTNQKEKWRNTYTNIISISTYGFRKISNDNNLTQM